MSTAYPPSGSTASSATSSSCILRGGLKVNLLQPQRALGLEGWGTFALVSVDKDRTRLIARGGIPRGGAAALYAVLMEIPHFVMERRMLLGIKQRTEASRR
jgi:hypothetical protein